MCTAIAKWNDPNLARLEGRDGPLGLQDAVPLLGPLRIGVQGAEGLPVEEGVVGRLRENKTMLKLAQPFRNP